MKKFTSEIILGSILLILIIVMIIVLATKKDDNIENNTQMVGTQAEQTLSKSETDIKENIKKKYARRQSNLSI